MAVGKFGSDLDSIAYASIAAATDLLTVCDVNGNDLGTGPEDKKIAVGEFIKRSLGSSDLSWMSSLANMAAVDGAADVFVVYDANTTSFKTLSAALVKNALLTTTDVSGLGALADLAAVAESADKVPVWDASAPAIKMLPISSLTRTAVAVALGWLSIMDPAYGAVPSPGTDNTTAIVNCINAAGADSTVFIPEGVFEHGPITHTATFTGGIRICGVNRFASILRFVPTSNNQVGITIDRTSGGSTDADIFNGFQLDNIGLKTTDTGFNKTGLKLIDAGQTVLLNVNIFGYTGTLKDAVGLWTLGRQSLWANNLQITACVPIRIGVNPDISSPTPGYLSADHFTFHNLYATAYGTTDALVSSVVLVDSTAHVSQLQFTGSQAWVGGSYGLYWNMAADTAAYCSSVRLENVRTEGGALSTGYSVYIAARSNTPLFNLSFVNCEWDPTREGVYTRYVYHQTWDAVLARQVSPRIICNIDSDAYSVTWRGVMTSTTASTVGVAMGTTLYLAQADPQPGAQIWPTNASWVRRNVAANYNERPSREMSAHKWYWAGQIADDAKVQMPCNYDTNKWEVATVKVVAVIRTNATTGVYARGEFDLIPYDDGAGSDNGVVKVSGTSNALSTDVDTNLCVYCDGAAAMGAGVYVKNRLGGTAWVTIEVTGKRSVET